MIMFYFYLVKVLSHQSVDLQQHDIVVAMAMVINTTTTVFVICYGLLYLYNIQTRTLAYISDGITRLDMHVSADPCSPSGICNFVIIVVGPTSSHSFYFSIINSYSDLIE